MPDAIPDLPIALRRVLTEIMDLDLQDHFQRVFNTAARAINQLRDLDLSQYEVDVTDETQNLELLESVAPFLVATINEVNGLVTDIREHLPEGQPLAQGDPVDIDKADRAAEILRSRSQALHTEVMQLGFQLRSPRAVADRWNFLNHLQTARGRLRVGIGEMVADAASVYAEVSRQAVIPEYQEDVDVAVGLRRTLNRLGSGLRAQLRKLEAGKAPPLPSLLAGLSATMETLARTKTWRELRAPDKKEFIHFRHQLKALLADGASPQAAIECIKGFVSFLELLAAVINQRETLRTHDHACLADLTAQLEHLEGLSPAQRRGAPVAKLLSVCERLVGRDSDLDDFYANLKASPEGDAAQIASLRELAQRLIQG